MDTYDSGDELEGKVTKVVSFGAFVEILDGVEGLVHISELAQHHVENPREVVGQDDKVKVKILEIDSERRRLSLSVKRVEGQTLPLRSAAPPQQEGGGGEVADEDLDNVPELDLSDEVFAGADGSGGEGGEDAASANGAEGTASAEVEDVAEDARASEAGDAGDGEAPSEAEAPADEAR